MTCVPYGKSAFGSNFLLAYVTRITYTYGTLHKCVENASRRASLRAMRLETHIGTREKEKSPTGFALPAGLQ